MRIEEVSTLFSADMQFVGQTHLVRVALPSPAPDRDLLASRFAEACWARFRIELPEIRANLVNLNCSVIGRRPEPDLTGLIDPAGRAATLEGARTAARPVWFAAGGWQRTPVYRRDRLPLNAVLTGPAVIEQLDCTTLLEPGDRAEGDPHGNLVITLAPAS